MVRAVLLLALAACPGPRGENTARLDTPKDLSQAVRGAVEQWRQAYEIRSIDALEKLYAHDSGVVVVEDAQQLIGWPAVDAMLKDRLAHAKEIHVRLKDVQVAARGSVVATAVTTLSREISDGTTTVSEQGPLTLVLHNAGDGWRIVAEHLSYRRPG